MQNQPQSYFIDLIKGPRLDVKITENGFSVSDGTQTFRYHAREAYDFKMSQDPFFGVGRMLMQFNAQLETPNGDIRGSYMPPLGSFDRGSMQVTSAPASIRLEHSSLRSDVFGSPFSDPRIVIDDRSSETLDPKLMIKKDTMKDKYRLKEDEKKTDSKKTDTFFSTTHDDPYSILHQTTGMPSFKQYTDPIKEKFPEKELESLSIKPRDSTSDLPNFKSNMGRLKAASISLGVAAALMLGTYNISDISNSHQDEEDALQKKVKDALKNLQVDNAYRMFEDAQKMAEKQRFSGQAMHVSIDWTVSQ